MHVALDGQVDVLDDHLQVRRDHVHVAQANVVLHLVHHTADHWRTVCLQFDQVAILRLDQLAGPDELAVVHLLEHGEHFGDPLTISSQLNQLLVRGHQTLGGIAT